MEGIFLPQLRVLGFLGPDSKPCSAALQADCEATVNLASPNIGSKLVGLLLQEHPQKGPQFL